MKPTPVLLVAIFALLAGTLALAATPPELGRIEWLRDFDLGLEEARKAGKPLLLLFQEVPG